MPNVRDKQGWTQLVGLLEEIESAGHTALVEAFRRVLRALVRRLAEQTFGYAIPQRISLPAMNKMVGAFLDTPSGGFRPLAVATALLDTIGKAFGLFSHVEAQGINEADAVFRNNGTLTADAGEAIQLDVDFDVPFGTSGGSFDLQYEFELMVDGEATQSVDGVAPGVSNVVSTNVISTLNFDPFAVSHSDSQLLLTFTTFWRTNGNFKISALDVTVPQNSIDVSVVAVPLPTAVWLLTVPLLGLTGVWKSQRREVTAHQY